MTYGMIAVNVMAAMLIALVIWWFFGDKFKTGVPVADSAVTIIIKDGVYQPSLIQIPANKQVTLHFLREDDSACAKTVIFPQLNLSFELPKSKIANVVLPPQPPGTLDFTCRMGMYRGKLVVS